MSDPIRVMQIMGHMSGGGVEATIMNHYRFIDRSAVQFDFVVDADSTLVPSDEIESLGGRVFVVPPYKELPKYMKACKQIFTDYKPDIVHSNLNALSAFPLSAAKASGVRVRIAHSHNTANRKELIKTALKDVLRPFSTVFPTHLAACSYESGKWLFGGKTVRQGRVHIVKNAIDLDRFEFDPLTRSKVRQDMGINENQLVIGQVGRFCAQKNQLFALEVFADLLRIRPDAVLLLVGDGALRSQINQKARALKVMGHVRFLGQRKDVEKLYQAFDALIFPSLYEGLGMAAIEAQAAGLPVLMSENVPNEAIISPESVSCLSLNSGTDIWAQELLDMVKTVERAKSNRKFFSQSGYDIRDGSRALARWYEQCLYGKSC